MRVYYVDVYGDVTQVQCNGKDWVPGSQKCFKAPRPKTPLAAVVYPDDSNTDSRPTDNPEIHIFCIDISDENTPSIQQFVKNKDSNSWSQGKDVPATGLISVSALAAVAYKGPHIRVYWQDKTHYIRQTIAEKADDSDWKVSDTKISDAAAVKGTPIAAAPQASYTTSPDITVAWHDTSHQIVATKVTNDSPTKYQFPTSYSASPTGTIAILSWSSASLWIYYDGPDDGIQRISHEYKDTVWSWKGQFNTFTGNIMTPRTEGQGSLAAASFSPAKDGSVGSVFYQIPGHVDISQLRLPGT
ncbi:hypothetical protein SISSUDRAFT_541253 [Sistotremastrum suecicum HHB10207 ss-3]|uniref:Uncharacterized protein n=1 Tax=Sistotremastrum suecicum HHB10207 ss-3 TaxID=1314776 RepID=A0A166F1R9_9AGAM|nr:hypothetical protein SISSUDRAFT_541253 [Sistotremastrum suecicum HHB10207 ss-3]